MKKIQLISSDLNGTLIHQHTMSDMIRIAFPDQPERFEKAKHAFNQQTAGLLSMEQAFAIAGPLTKGLSLRTVIEYTVNDIRFLGNFKEFIETLYRHHIYFVINSTGYSVTTKVIEAVYGTKFIHDVICNRLIFEYQGKKLSEQELFDFIVRYFQGDRNQPIYDNIQASGDVELGILDEGEKARLLFEISDRLGIPRSNLVHIGDTIGDSLGIVEVARHGGIGIAFNYNQPLKNYLDNILNTESIPGQILFISPKSDSSNIRSVLEKLELL